MRSTWRIHIQVTSVMQYKENNNNKTVKLKTRAEKGIRIRMQKVIKKMEQALQRMKEMKI